jgi:hypothetical protein
VACSPTRSTPRFHQYPQLLCVADMTQRMRTVLIRVALAFSSIIFSCVLAEGFLHLLVPQSRGDLFMFTSHSMRYKVMRPNNRAIVYGVPFQTNQLGFRDQTAGLPIRERGEERIIVFGDSYTASAGVPYQLIYTEIAERDLAHLAGKPRIKIMNLATGGYNVLQFYYTLTESGLSLLPDYVVVAVLVAEDFDRMNLYANARRIALGGVPGSPAWIDRLYLTRAFGLYVRHIYSRLLTAVETNHPAPASSGDLEERRINEQALLDIQGVLAQRQTPLLVMLLPECYDFSKQKEKHVAVGDFLRTHNIEFIDMLPLFISDGHRPGYFGLNIIDRHPNARYHELVGRELAKVLATRLATKSARSAGEGFLRSLDFRDRR